MALFDRFKKKKPKEGLKVGIDVSAPARPISQTDFTGFTGTGGVARDFTKAGQPVIPKEEFQRLSDPSLGLNVKRFGQQGVLPGGELAPLSEAGRREERAFGRAEEFFGEGRALEEERIRKLQEIQTTPEVFGGKTPEEVEGKSKLREIMENPRTPAALAIGIAGLLTAGIATGAFALGGTAAAVAGTTASRAVITRTATEIGRRGAIVTAQRAFIGKPAVTGISKIFHAVRPIASRFATNSKSMALTQGFLSQVATSPAAIIGLIGTYPFAGFIKEEALQTLSFAAKTATDNKDVVGMQNAIIRQEEVLDPNTWDSIMNKIPFANVLNQLKSFYKAARIKLDNDKKTLERLQGGQL